MTHRRPWANSDRASRLPADWPRRRAAVLRRDAHTCRLGYPKICTLLATEVDHRTRGDDHALSNLQAVCAPCHQHKTNHVDRPKRTRPPNQHPGLTS